MKIPIGNLYFMLLYAWDAQAELEEIKVDAEDYSAPVDLLARILLNRVEKLLRSGLNRGYQAKAEELLGVRGRIDIGQSVKSRGMQMGRLVCEFDELDYSVLHNQIIRTTLARLVRTSGIELALANELRRVERRLAHIEPIVLSESVFDRVILHRNISNYRLPIHICKLLYQQLLPLDKEGRFVFRDFTEERLAALFEGFLRNFYKQEQRHFAQVKRERFQWQASSHDKEALSYLPFMETDISLLNESERLVVEAKFYEEALRSKFETSKKTLISGHLYQVAAYLANLSLIDNRACRALILYPRVKENFDFQYRILNHPIRVAAIDLTLPAETLRKQLLSLIEPIDQVTQ